MVGTRSDKAIFKVTEKAAQQIATLLAQREQESYAIRIGVKKRGCSGNAYTLEYADAPNPMDKVVQEHGVTILIDPKALLFVIGTEMDYVETPFESGFKFINPNEKGRCGCGESFHV